MTAYVVFSRERMRNRVEYEIYREKSRPVNASRTADPIELAVLGVNCFYDHPPRAELRWRSTVKLSAPRC